MPRSHRGMERKASRVTLLLKNLDECCCIDTALYFDACLSARVSQLPGMSSDEFIADGKRAARFAVAILWEESAANNLPCLRPSACCVQFASRSQMAN